MTKPRIIVVLGMHRSGTSAIARGLKTLSVELGDNLMPAAPDNEKGFWEDMDIYSFNERLLSKLGSAWDRMTPVTTDRLIGDAFAIERYEAVALLESKFSKSPIFGFKDPRTSILLPFWQCIFGDMGIEDNYVLAVRNPLEVAESLRKRGQLNTMGALLLWLKYNWAAVENSTGRKRICVLYPQLIADPTEQLARMAMALDLTQPAPSSPTMFEYVSEFLSKDLAHNRISDNEIQRSGGIPAAVKTLYDLLLAWSKESGAAFEVPSEAKIQIESYLSESRPLLELSDSLQAQITADKIAKSELATSLEQARQQLAERDKHAADLQTAGASSQNEIIELRHQLKVTTESLTERVSQIAHFESKEFSARSEIADLKTQLQTSTDSLTERAKRITHLEAAEVAARDEVNDLKAQLQIKIDILTERASKIENLETLLAQNTTTLRLAEERHTQSQQQLTEALVEIERHKLNFADAFNTNISKDRKISSLQQQLDKLIRESKQAEAQINELQAAEAQLDQIRTELRMKEEAHHASQEELSRLQQHINSIQERLSTLLDEDVIKTNALRSLRLELNAVRSSTSWKVTKPLRILRTASKHPRQALGRFIRNKKR